MKCPTCPDATLVIADRAGIEIDYCLVCRGVWLDRGELDKIVERSAATAVGAGRIASAAPAPGSDRYDRRRDDDDDDDRRRYEREHEYGRDQHGYRKKKKSSFLGDLFDF